jgi:hypothetical protein
MSARMLIVLSCLAAVGLTSACGRKSDPLTPYQAQVEAQKEAQKEGRTAPTPEKPVADRPFILDRLIE